MQHWTSVVMAELQKHKDGLTVAQLHALPHVAKMEAQHRAERKARGAFIEWPVNSMIYDTLYRLRKRGVVSYDKGVYKLIK